MKPDDWDALPWYQTRALIEGLEDEGLIERNVNTLGIDLTSADAQAVRDLGFVAEEVVVGA
jgi:uncharacterized NAD(P)/FAD-binding protein YdhS